MHTYPEAKQFLHDLNDLFAKGKSSEYQLDMSEDGWVEKYEGFINLIGERIEKYKTSSKEHTIQSTLYTKETLSSLHKELVVFSEGVKELADGVAEMMKHFSDTSFEDIVKSAMSESGATSDFLRITNKHLHNVKQAETILVDELNSVIKHINP